MDSGKSPSIDLLSKNDGVRILSLDGGDLSCISQLKILEEFMKRVEHDSGNGTKPCEYFHSITGVGASGVLAILLGVLGLSINDANAAFIRLCEAVSLGDQLEPHIRSEKLIAAVDVLLQETNVPITSKLRGDLFQGHGCKVSVPYVSAVDMAHCRMLQSYEAAVSSYNPTITEAIRIAWATPGLFSPVQVEANSMQEELLSAVDGFSNPTLQAVKATREAFGGDQKVACVLSLGAGKSSNRSSSTDGQELAQLIARDTENTAEQLKNRYSGLRIYFRISVDRSLDFGVASGHIERRAGRISSYTSNFLETYDISKTLDRCLRSSRQASKVNLEDLYRTRASGSRSSHGLPPLSAFFVARTKPLNDIAMALRTRFPGSPAIGIVTGLSGTGKTQISLRYAYNHDDEYDHIIFVDASSAESLEKGLITRIKALDRQLDPTDAEEALSLLIDPEGNLTRNWLVIMDNADNVNLDLADFIPSCDHGCILITSRNAALSDLNPDGHVAMDVMTREEAVEALLSAAIGPKPLTASEEPDESRIGRQTLTRTKKDYDTAERIVEELGCLPLAVIQAACYIKKQKGLHEYSALLKSSRARVLRWPASVQRDKLKYAHSTYASFDTTLSALSPRALQFLGIISFCNFSDFPKSLIPLAASLKFSSQPHQLLDRPTEYQLSIDLLQQLFCPNGEWDPMELDSLLEELQNYSLVTLVPVSTVVTLRFHPLLHSWGRDRLSEFDRILFRAAAVRLLVCGTDDDDDYLRPYLSPHVERLPLLLDELHVNDRAALTVIPYADGHREKVKGIWEDIYGIVKDFHGERHERTTRAALHLADAIAEAGDWDKMEEMEREVVTIRKEDTGEDHLETVYAMANLARTCKFRGGRYKEAIELELHVLQVRRKLLGPNHREIVQALSDLASTYTSQANHKEARILLVEALDMITALVGRVHVATIRIMEQLALCYAQNKEKKESIKLDQEVIASWRTIRGDMHAKTLDAMAKLGTSYSEQGQHQESEDIWRKVADGRRDMLGSMHYDTILASYKQAKAIQYQNRHADAEILLNEVVASWKSTRGDHDVDTLNAQHALGYVVQHQKNRWVDSEKILLQVVAGRRITFGDTHEQTMLSSFWLSRALYGQGRYAEVEALLKDILAPSREIRGEQHEETVNILYTMAHAVSSQERYADAEKLFKEVVVARQSTLGDQHVSTYKAFFQWVKSIHSQGRLLEAERLWTELVSGLQESLGENHEDTLRAKLWLEKTQQALVVEAPDSVPKSDEIPALTDAPSADDPSSTDLSGSHLEVQVVTESQI